MCNASTVEQTAHVLTHYICIQGTCTSQAYLFSPSMYQHYAPVLSSLAPSYWYALYCLSTNIVCDWLLLFNITMWHSLERPPCNYMHAQGTTKLSKHTQYTAINKYFELKTHAPWGCHPHSNHLLLSFANQDTTKCQNNATTCKKYIYMSTHSFTQAWAHRHTVKYFSFFESLMMII